MSVHDALCVSPQLLRKSLEERMYAAAEDVEVIVETQGRVVLQGRADSFYQKQFAQEAIVELPGVAEVVNQIEVSHRTS